jgi:hypothetical protein
VTIERAQAVRTYDHKILLYSNPIKPLARAVYDTPLNDRDLCRTRSGIYAFRVQGIEDEERHIVRGDVIPTVMPLFINQTVLQKARKFMHK